LRSMVQQLDNTQLSRIFTLIDEEEREMWKSYLKGPVGEDVLRKANGFISNQIIEEIIVPSLITDPKVTDLLLRIKPDEAARFTVENPSLGKIVMNVMNTKFIAKMLNFVTAQEADEIISASANFDKAQVESQLGALKEKIAKYISAKAKSPF